MFNHVLYNSTLRSKESSNGIRQGYLPYTLLYTLVKNKTRVSSIIAHLLRSRKTFFFFSVTVSNEVSDDNETKRDFNNDGPCSVRPLSNASCQRPLRLGLSRKRSGKPLHASFNRRSDILTSKKNWHHTQKQAQWKMPLFLAYLNNRAPSEKLNCYRLLGLKKIPPTRVVLKKKYIGFFSIINHQK